ncbi:uncharacterized protein si:ch73-43g23.1 [Nematolebias whitei]|uniref:uncharacterized protein si:ch73-43g23.1 n=1 Tax=Nematolebias whitei TaxID=451745 RepID=UPI00189966BD|nr:uncharacterized protein si:ch73-43g23.1 [Nematolebias whitei]
MDSWTLQGDSYSFLRSAPRTFSLCHRDGTPNHVEIFDIINVPAQRSAISETTCLCDIFGDDRESPSLSSSPSAGAFVSSQRVEEGTTAASPQLDELNDSSGSYHTAQGSSEGEEGFEESKEGFYSPILQNDSSDGRQLEDKELSSEYPQVSDKGSSDLEQKGVTPVPQLRAGTPSSVTPSSQDLNCSKRTPSPGCYSPSPLHPEGRLSSLSSSSSENRLLSSSPNLKQSYSETELRRITPSFKNTQSSSSTQSLSPSPSLPENLFEPKATDFHKKSSPSPQFTPLSQDFTASDLEFKTFISSPLPSTSGLESKSYLEAVLVSPNFGNSSPSPDIQGSSPLSELRGRVSLPDLFSRGSTPDICFAQDFAQSTEHISDSSTGEKDTATIPESPDIGFSVEPGSTVSTPGPCYTPPSSAVSVLTTPELVGDTVKPELKNTSTSPSLLSPASPSNTGSRSPSPEPSFNRQNSLTFSEIGTQVSSPVVSLSPSPAVEHNCSPIEDKYTSPSPEIRITASSPEIKRKEKFSPLKTGSESPLLDPHFGSTSPRSLTSSPHFTGISYSVVQPEDRTSPPFPELQGQRTLVSSGINKKSTNSSVVVSTGTPQHSTSSSVSLSEALLLPQSRNQTHSPQPNTFTPSPEPRDLITTFDKLKSPSSQHRSRDPSPEASLSVQRYQQSPATLSTEYNPLYTKPTSVRSTPEIKADSVTADTTETQSLTHLENNSVPPLFDLYRRERKAVIELPNNSPVEAIHSPISELSDKISDSSLIQQTTERDETIKEACIWDRLSVVSSIEEKQDNHSPVFQEEVIKFASPNLRSPEDRNQDIHSPFFEKEVKSASPNLRAFLERNQNIHSPFFEKETIKSASPNPRAPEDRNQDTHSPSFEKEVKPASPNPRAPEESNPNISPVNRVIFNSPCQNLHPEFTSPSFNFNNNVYSPKWVGTPESPKRQLLTKVKCEDKARLTQDMSHHRRQTPSPPLIRFTPVHIIAPEKPYRQWQRKSPSQALASKPSSNLKQEVTNRDSPNADLADTTSQAHWIQLRKQMEMDRKMSLEQERDLGMDGGMNREMEEEHAPEREAGWQGAASYRGEQAELSFSARNRKGPASHSAGPTSREASQGLPTAHSYPESLLVTRQLQQQQSLPKLPSQQDTLGGSTSRKLQPASQDRKRAPRRLATNRPCQSSSSSMGSELDEADNEVKWLTDVAFRRLSSPEIDYLDMYNSSHCSSTNISQPSTQESPAGVNAAWMAYADFRGSAPKLDHDELSFHQPSTQYSDGLDSSRQYELGSFECIDVAVEREDCRRVRRGVPKRQIQLKRKNTVEGKQDESSENSSPGVPAMVESPSQEGHSRGTFMRQHSTPAAMQECRTSDGSAELDQQKIRQSKFQKSASMDETYSKTKMASCLIKNVLSKKMQSTDRQPDEQANEEASLSSGSVVAPLKESPKPDSRDLSSSLQSDYSLSSEGVSVRGESSTNEQTKLPKSYGVRCNTRPSSSSSGRSVTFSLTDIGEDVSHRRSAKLSESEVKSELNLEFECGSELTPGREAINSANATAWDTGASSASEATDTQARVTNRDQECENTEPHKQVLQGDKGTSRTQEITVKSVEKKKASLNVCLTPETENKPFSPGVSNRQNEEKTETHVEEKTEDEGHEDNPTKAPMHKVRDVRQLVKNTYSLSFKAATAVHSSNVNDEKMENFNEERREEVSAADERDATQEIKIEEKRENKEKTIWMEKNKEQKEAEKDPNLQILPQNKGSSLSSPQIMQIEYKAVCWKDDKNKRSSIQGDLSDKPQESFKYLSKEFEELQSSNPDSANQTTENKEVHKLCEHNFNITAEMQKNISKTHKEPVSEENPVMTKTDQKPPMLESLSKLPSKEREVSTAVVLIREKQNKSNVLVSSNKEEALPSIQASAPASLSPGPFTPSSTSGTGGHSVSMLLKEKGYQADIGAVVSDNQSSAGLMGVPPKHVNSLKIPLQSIPPSDEGLLKSHRDETFSSSTTSGPSSVTDNTNIVTKSKEGEGVIVKPQDTAKQKITSLEPIPSPAKQKDTGDFEAVKRIDPTFPPRSPAIRKFKPKPVEVKLLSKEAPKQEMLTNLTGNNRPQTIEVRSIAKNSQKPAVPPKPNCKFRPADLGNLLNDTQRTSATSSSSGKPQVEERPQTIVVSSPTIYRKISNESMATSNYSKKLTVSAVSSLKPPPHRPTATTISTPTSQPKTSSDTEASTDRVQHQQSAASPQSPRTAPKTASLTTTPAASLDVTSASDSSSDPKPNQIPGVLPSEASQSAAADSDSPLQFLKGTCHLEQALPGTLNTNQLTGVSPVQEQSYTHQPYGRSVSSEHARRLDNLHFYASDDPPSYDERESFSPLLLPDLTPLRSNRYQPSSRPPPCPCTAGIPPHSGHTSPHHHRSPHNFTPPGPTHSSYQVSQPPQHPLKYRHDPQPTSYQPGSPKSSPLGPNQPMYQPLHQSAPCPPHPSLMQACPADRSMQPPQHIGPRRPPVHRSPHQQSPNIAGAPYSDPGHSHSPGLPPIDPQYMCGPQTMGSSYGSEYGGDSSSLYSESSFGQTPRRVLLDPETGKYFFIEVPVQPLRKMLFDPETGQYVEVLIPQQAMSHSGLYPPSAAPFPPLHNPNMYAPAPQYMPCAAPPPLAHPQAQPPQYLEASAAATMHPNRPGVGYRNPCQGSKPDPPNHPPLDHSYLENRYYVPTGINVSPNPTPPDYYHKHPPNMPTTGGNRS